MWRQTEHSFLGPETILGTVLTRRDSATAVKGLVGLGSGILNYNLNSQSFDRLR